MARQKSLRKRLSSYNKHSVGSAVLDSDTDIIGDEQPLWWEKLGNNTIVRPSMNSNMLNETSCQLDTNSEIESNLAVTDGWWKVLETSNVLNSLKMNKSRMLEKDTANNNTSTSESEEEEPRIAKRMFPPLIRKRKSEGYQEIVNEEPQGEKVTKLDLLAFGHTGVRDRVPLVVFTVSRHEKHRHVHDIRGRQFGGLHLDVLLLRRIRGEPTKREHRERDDDLTYTVLQRIHLLYIYLSLRYQQDKYSLFILNTFL